MSNHIVGVKTDDGIEWHVTHVSGPDYDTLCSVDASDAGGGTYGTVVAAHGQKVTCVQCYRLWNGIRALGLRSYNFSDAARTG